MTFMVNSAECLEIAGVPTERKGEKHSYLRLTAGSIISKPSWVSLCIETLKKKIKHHLTNLQTYGLEQDHQIS